MSTPPANEQSIVVIVLGPAVIGALLAALIYWMRSRRTPRP